MLLTYSTSDDVLNNNAITLTDGWKYSILKK